MLTYAMHLISIARISLDLIIVGISLIVLIPEDT